jgi:hypothetical protein
VLEARGGSYRSSILECRAGNRRRESGRRRTKGGRKVHGEEEGGRKEGEGEERGGRWSYTVYVALGIAGTHPSVASVPRRLENSSKDEKKREDDGGIWKLSERVRTCLEVHIVGAEHPGAWRALSNEGKPPFRPPIALSALPHFPHPLHSFGLPTTSYDKLGRLLDLPRSTHTPPSSNVDSHTSTLLIDLHSSTHTSGRRDEGH